MLSSGWNRKRQLGRKGNVALEFALVASALFALLFGGLDLGRYYITAQSVRELAGELARAAVINSSLAGCEAPRAYVRGIPALSDPAKLTACVVRTAGAVSTTVTVTAAYQFNFSFWLLRDRVSSITETTTINAP